MIWEKEKQILDALISHWLDSRKCYLDFACGTGRVLSHLEKRFTESTGIDISEDMLKCASSSVSSSTLICGDLTRDPNLVNGKYDCITAFRFFLHSQQSLRYEAMHVLSEKLRDRNSILIFNIHGNRYSS